MDSPVGNTSELGRAAPLISVIMPVYNGERYLREAIDSILGQTLTSIEFIIVDDGSTDATWEITHSYADPRIVLLRHSTNQGIVQSLNDGLSIARCDLIARQDADDVSLPDRLERQLAYMAGNPDLGLLGTSCIHISEVGDCIRMGMREARDPRLRWLMCFQNPFVHTSVVFRRHLAERVGGYSALDMHSEDYGLWSRLASISKLSNLPTPLVKFRRHEESVTSKYRPMMRESAARICRDYISQLLGCAPGPDEVRWLRIILGRKTHLVDGSRLRRELATLLFNSRHLSANLVDALCLSSCFNSDEEREFRSRCNLDFANGLLAMALYYASSTRYTSVARQIEMQYGVMRLVLTACQASPKLIHDRRILKALAYAFVTPERASKYKRALITVLRTKCRATKVGKA